MLTQRLDNNLQKQVIMEFDFDNDKGIELLSEIITKENLKNSSEPSEDEIETLDVLFDNILHIAMGHGYETMQYFADAYDRHEAKKMKVDPVKQKLVYETTLKKQALYIKLLKDYFETNDLKPMQEYLTQLK